MAENSTLRLAWRGLGRNRKRSVLAIAAIGLGQFAFLASAGIMRGYADHYFDSVTGPLVGHVQIVAPGWREERAVDQTLSDVEAMLAAIRGQSQVARAVPRIYAPVLAALEEDGFVGMVVGADPTLEGDADGLLGSEELADSWETVECWWERAWRGSTALRLVPNWPWWAKTLTGPLPAGCTRWRRLSNRRLNSSTASASSPGCKTRRHS